MYGAMITAVVAVLVGVSVATPAPDFSAHGTSRKFSIHQVAVGRKAARHPAQMMMRTYAKYGRVSHAPSALTAAAANGTGTVAANPEKKEIAYLSPVRVGNSTLNVDLDTGSSDPWFFSTLQSASQRQGHDVYDVSSGTLLPGYSWKVLYGDDSTATGRVYKDTLTIGGVTSFNQSVQAATSVSEGFLRDQDNDGIVGLGFGNVNTVKPTKQTTWFDNVKKSLAKPLFTVRLRKGAAGTYDFGFIDSSKYSGSIEYVDVDTTKGYWAFKSGSSSVSSTSIGSSILDTGTTLFYLPNSLVTAYYRKVSGAASSDLAGGYVFPCTTKLPDFKVNIGSGSYTVPGANINVGVASEDGEYCFGGIQSNTGIGFSIFGDVFLKSNFVVFDQSQSTPRLGFATSK